jgi:hypothetical protein
LKAKPYRFLEPIGEDVRRELKRFGPSGAMPAVVNAWPEAVGSSIARNAWPARIARDGTLHIATSSSAWAFELGLLEDEIRKRLTAVVGGEAPTALRFAPGNLPEPPVTDKLARPSRRVEPSPEERREADRLAAAIEDENLRKVVAEAAAASLASAARRPGRLVH